MTGSPLDDGLLSGQDALDAGAGLLRVDPVEHADEVARFWAKVVQGPDLRDYALWVGAISDDGYGRQETSGIASEAVFGMATRVPAQVRRRSLAGCLEPLAR